MSAATRIDELKKRFDENPRRFFAPLANEYRKSGDLEQAISLCEAHLPEQPGNMNAHVVYGQALFEVGRLDEAKATFGTALTLDPENLIALRHLGDIARTNGDAPQAREWYERVLDADPRNDEIIAFLAELGAVSPPEPNAAPPSSPQAEALAEAPTVEMNVPRARTPARATPVVPFEEEMTPARSQPPVQSPPAEPFALMDLAIDLGGDSDIGFEEGIAGLASPTSPTQEAGTVPMAPSASREFEAFETIDFGEELASEPSVPPAFRPEPEPAAIDAGASMFGDMDLTDDIELSDAAPQAVEGSSAPPTGADLVPPPEAPPQTFVTETMAELYLQQGFRDEALAVYRQLAELNPDDEKLLQRMRSFDATPAMPQALVRHSSSSGAARGSAREFFATLSARRAVRHDGTPVRGIPVVSAGTGADASAGPAVVPGGTLDHLFGDTGVASDQERLALAFAQIADGVEVAPGIKGKPTQQAATELSLDSVFRATPSPRASIGAVVPRVSQTLRFDQFFTPTGEATPTVDPAAPPPLAGDPGSPADLEQFQGWLQHLKKP